ncbi:MAG: ParA family protein (plasmid) [Candidatus Symbiodolus clandestinus]
MKTLVLANQKGGVGKSAIACQLAYYFRENLKQRVLMIDLDHQGNSSKVMRLGGIPQIASLSSSHIFLNPDCQIDDADFVAVVADSSTLLKMEKQAEQHNTFASNLYSFLKNVSDKFDVCVIDTNPNPDIRQLSALVVCNYVLSPIQLNQEAIDGIGGLLNHENVGIRKIQATINRDLKLIGILPNLVEPTTFQRENLGELVRHFSKLLIPLAEGMAAIKKTTAIPEAQALGIPIWKLSKTSARDAWVHIRPIFGKIAETMGICNGT